jgi:hypothetical protein
VLLQTSTSRLTPAVRQWHTQADSTVTARIC